MPSLQQTHRALCFKRAFPNSAVEHDAARSGLLNFEEALDKASSEHRYKLIDSGIAGTTIYYRFSFAVARWLALNAPGEVSIDWDDIEDTTRLDELLTRLQQPAEDEYFNGGYVTSREWIDVVRDQDDGTDFDWLMAQIGDRSLQPFWAQMYDAVDLPLAWNLRGSAFSISRNAIDAGTTSLRERGMRPRPRSVRREIQRPLETCKRLSKRAGAKLINVAMASLAARHRETYHFNFANPREVYVANVGEGVQIAIFGLLPQHRFPLECTMGFLILSNGAPIGYGGSSILFKQVNTGINVFEEYRGSEAAYLWVQVMRVYHALTGCTRFIANPYQFGGDNDEALQSGAFWFYYRLGYRPVDTRIKNLAQQEASKIQRNRKYRSNITTLRRLASCDMHFTLPGARATQLFDEAWIETSSMLASRVLGAAGHRVRSDSVRAVARQLQRDLGIRKSSGWSAEERRAFDAIAPIVAAIKPGSWLTEDKRAMRELLRAKGGASELDYARRLASHNKLLISLRKMCKRAEQE